MDLKSTLSLRGPPHALEEDASVIGNSLRRPRRRTSGSRSLVGSVGICPSRCSINARDRANTCFEDPLFACSDK
jgi:hypothetical protein